MSFQNFIAFLENKSSAIIWRIDRRNPSREDMAKWQSKDLVTSVEDGTLVLDPQGTGTTMAL
jgi:hypothetical protein